MQTEMSHLIKGTTINTIMEYTHNWPTQNEHVNKRYIINNHYICSDRVKLRLHHSSRIIFCNTKALKIKDSNKNKSKNHREFRKQIQNVKFSIQVSFLKISAKFAKFEMRIINANKQKKTYITIQYFCQVYIYFIKS